MENAGESSSLTASIFTDFSSEFEPLPPSILFDSLDDLVDAVQDHMRANGACVVKKSPTNYRDFSGTRKPTSISLLCDRGRSRPSESTGLRLTASRKRDCPFKLMASASKSTDWKWSYRVKNSSHNHPPSLDPSAHTIHRRRTKEQQDLARSLARYQGVPAREMGSILRDQAAIPSFFTDRDIYNDRQALKKQLLNGLSPTQAWIQLLQNEDIRHQVRYDDQHRISAVFWTYPWCEGMWKTYPEVLGLDNTYKTNRFKMYLFQVTGLTDQMKVMNFAFGLINSELEKAYDWLCAALDSFREQIGVAAPRVIVTDKETGLKNALSNAFPEAQQQLCVYHINANIRGRIFSKWKGPDDPADDAVDEAADDADEGDASEDELAGPTDDDFAAARRVEEEAFVRLENPDSTPTITPQPAETDDANSLTPDKMFSAWQRVIFAPNEVSFDEAWQRMIDDYNETQRHILRYIVREYFAWRHQWAQCFISLYRNYGQRVNSPVESAHKQLKSYLLNGTADLFRIHTAMVQMLKDKERQNTQQIAQQDVSTLNVYMRADWMGDLPLLISRPALSLLWQQGKRARAADPSLAEPIPLDPCSQVWGQQHGLPCKHRIFDAIVAGVPLQKEEVHPRWWLRKPVDVEDEIRRIRDPAIVVRLRGRPRGSKNKKIAIPANYRPPAVAQATSTQNASSRSTPASSTRPPPPSSSRSSRSSRTPTSTTQQPHETGRRSFPASLRRDPSHFEDEYTAGIALQAERSKRARLESQPASRGQGTRGRARGTAATSRASSSQQLRQRQMTPEGDCIVIPATQPED